MNNKKNMCLAMTKNDKRCSRKTKQILCYQHLQKKNQKFCTDDLDKDHSHTLFGIFDSWKEISLKNIVLFDGVYWCVNILLEHFTSQINITCMSNPKPKFPTNPFTNVKFKIEDIKTFFINIKNNKIKVHCSIKEFHKKIDSIYNCIICEPKNESYIITDFLSSSLRFKILNNKDSQGCYKGSWVCKNIKSSQFEQLLDLFQKTPRQITVNNLRNVRVVNNPRIRIIETLLNRYRSEDIELIKDVYLD
jgi:hypothetical protein